MATLHLVTGDKGGTGKTFLARTLAQYFADKEIDLALFDADRCNPLFKKIYQNAGCGEIILKESKEYENDARPAYLSAMEKTTLVDLPAQVIGALKKWFEKNSLFEMAQEHGVDFTIWFVSNGEEYSLELFDEYLSYFQERVNYVFVKNLHFCGEEGWVLLEENKYLQQKMNEYGVKIVNLPSFELDSCRHLIGKYALTFGAATQYQAFNVFDRQGAKTYLRKSYEAFDSAGAIYKDVEVVANELSAKKPSDSAKLVKLSKGTESANGKGKVKITSTKNEVIAEETSNSVGAL